MLNSSDILTALNDAYKTILMIYLINKTYFYNECIDYIDLIDWLS